MQRWDRTPEEKTGETTLLCSLLSGFGPTDVAVMDRYYCSFLMIAEFRTTLLAYNLIRSVSVTAALLDDTQPRQISFVSTCQYVLST